MTTDGNDADKSLAGTSGLGAVRDELTDPEIEAEHNRGIAIEKVGPERADESSGRDQPLEAELNGRLEHPGVAPESRGVKPPSGAAASLPSRFFFADALRGIAAMWVVLFHAYGGHLSGLMNSWYLAPVRVFFEAGHLGVQIFFVLSGFVISYSISRYRVDARFIGRFAVRRSGSTRRTGCRLYYL